MSWLPSSFPTPFFPTSLAEMTSSNPTFDVFQSREDRCKELQSPSTLNFAVTCGLVVWTIISYIPQYFRMIRRQSAEGLSTLYIGLGACSGVCAVANILMLPSSQVDIGCCRTNNTYPCIAGLLGMVQVINGVACFWGVMFLYVYYAREEADAERTGRRPSLSTPRRTFRRARKAWAVLLIVLAWMFLILIVCAVINHRFPWYAQNWADLLGVSVATLACTQWLPQIVTTWHLGHLGSLSVAMLALSTPSTWIFGFSLIARVGFAGWSAWIVYVLVGTMQLVLIITAIVFAIRDYKHGLPGYNTIETGMQGNAWLDDYEISSEEGDYVGPDDESMVAPDERMSLLSGRSGRRGSSRIRKGKGPTLKEYLGLGGHHGDEESDRHSTYSYSK